MGLGDKELYAAVNVFHMYAYFQCCRLFFRHNHVMRRKKQICFWILYVVNTTAFLFSENFPFTWVLTEIPVLFCLHPYWEKKQLAAGIFRGLFSFACLILLDSLGAALADLFPGFLPVPKILQADLISGISFCFFTFLFRKIYCSRSKKCFTLENRPMLSLFPACSIVIVLFLFCFDCRADVLLAVVTVIIFSGAPVMYLHHVVRRCSRINRKKALLQQQNDALAGQLEIYRKSEEDVRILRHDMENHLLALQSLLDNGKFDQLKKYLLAYSKKLESNAGHVFSGNPVIDSILNYKLCQAEKIGAEVILEVTLPSEIPVDPFDMNVILGNLMDNAIEAMRKNTEKKLRVNLFVNRGALFLIIENTYNGILKKGPEWKNKISNREKRFREAWGGFDQCRKGFAKIQWVAYG